MSAFPKRVKRPSPYNKLMTAVTQLVNNNNVQMTDSLEKDIPTHWEKRGLLVLLPGNCFTDEVWRQFGKELWMVVSKCLNCKQLAKKDTISQDGFRTPQVTLLYGDNPWVECVENGIKYTYDITKCMFSAGNITEKMRISKFDCSEEIVVDLYAGIGYFTLPYLVHAKAKHLHACEWNPNAVEALKKNLKLNKVEDRCSVYQGDNRQMCPKMVADRVNLGLIPSSENGWPVACEALKPTGGFLHIHSNVETKTKTESESRIYNLEKQDDTKTECKDHHNTEILVSDLKSKLNTSESHDTHDVNHKTLDKKKMWSMWAEEVSGKINKLMCSIHSTSNWSVTICHIEHVKSYAPHVDHVVLDLECRPI